MQRPKPVELFIAWARVSALVLGLTCANVVFGSSLKLERIARIQSFHQKVKTPTDIFDRDINSPKSVLFSADGTKMYVNSLEGSATVIYGWPVLKKLGTISHSFGPEDAGLFRGENSIFGYRYFQSERPVPNPNLFRGKPVEMTLSHGGRYLWVTYYRRSFDQWGQSPSAVAIIDTQSDRIVRVMPTGPIPKFVTASLDGRYVAITHWGDNTIGLIDTSSGDPSRFKYVAHMVVESQMSQAGMHGTERDVTCGFCLRGTVFTRDTEFLFVARMGGGGLAAFHVPTRRYLGSVMATKATPRHLALSPDGRELVVSNNVSGYVSKKSVESLISDFVAADGKRVQGGAWREVSVGNGARTLEISQDGRFAYVAASKSMKIVAVDLSTMRVAGEAPVDPYPVGLAISRDGNYVVVTSQGVNGHGGNAVNILRTRVNSNPKPIAADNLEEKWETRVESAGNPVDSSVEKIVERKPRAKTFEDYVSDLFR